MLYDKDSCPVAVSDSAGEGRNKTNKNKQEQLGQYFTPVEVANFMASQLEKPNSGKVRILDPGAGSGVLTAAAVKSLITRFPFISAISASLWEIDHELCEPLTDSMNHLKGWALSRNVEFTFQIHNDDFLIENAKYLSMSLKSEDAFDVVISNPPYFKISKSDERAISCAKIVYGQPNIYALFMGVSAALLKNEGQFLFITPRSFAAGQYFKAFRKYLFSKIQLTKIHQFESRKNAFDRDNVLQENVISYGIKSTDDIPKVELSISNGKSDLQVDDKLIVSKDEILNKSADDQLALPTSINDLNVLSKIKTFENTLESLGFKISTGPVVPFRAEEFLRQDFEETTVPLLWIQHIVPMKVKFPLPSFRKEQWIESNEFSKKLLVKNQNYILMRRFSPKEDFRRLTVAPYFTDETSFDLLGLENHLNYIYKIKGSMNESEVLGLAAFLNSHFYDTYFRMINGNTQVSATELRQSPIPDLSSILQIGSLLINRTNITLNEIDTIVNDILEIGEK